MNIFKRLALGAKLFYKMTLGELPRSFFSGLMGGGNTIRRANVDADPYGNLAGWVYYAIDRVSQRVASIEFELFRLGKQDELEQIFDHEVLSLLYRANPYQTKHDFVYMLVMYLRMWGSAPIWVETNKAGKPINVWPLRPDLLKIEQDKDTGGITGYTYQLGYQKTKEFSREEVVYIRKPSPQNYLKGYSVYFATALEIDADMAAAVWNRYVLENSAEPKVVLWTEQSLTDEQYENIRESWNARYQGPYNAGKTAILEGGLKPERISQNAQELDFVNSRKNSKEAILTQLGIPPSLVDPTANRANAETAKEWYNSETIEPIIRLITDQLNEFFVVRFDEGLWLSFENPVPENMEARRLENQVAVNVWKTINEVRSDYNLEPLEGGDVLYMPLGVIATVGEIPDTEVIDQATIDQINAAKAKAGGHVLPLRKKANGRFVSKKERMIVQKLKARTHFKRKLASDIAVKFEQKLSNAVNAKGGKTVLTVGLKKKTENVKSDSKEMDAEGLDLHEKVRKERELYVKKLPSRERRMKKLMAKYFKKQEEIVMANLEKIGAPKSYSLSAKKPEETKAYVDKLLWDRKKQVALLVSLSTPFYEDNVEEGGADVAELLGTSPIEILKNPAAIDYLKDKPFKFAEEVNDTTEKKLRSELAAALDNNEGVGPIGERIAKVFKEARTFRTETIARTETGSALNFGRQTEMAEQGVEKKMWVATFINTRDSHAEVHGEIVDINDTFDVGGETMEFPHDPSGSAENVINCQCSVSPYFKP